MVPKNTGVWFRRTRAYGFEAHGRMAPKSTGETIGRKQDAEGDQTDPESGDSVENETLPAPFRHRTGGVSYCYDLYDSERRRPDPCSYYADRHDPVYGYCQFYGEIGEDAPGIDGFGTSVFLHLPDNLFFVRGHVWRGPCRIFICTGVRVSCDGKTGADPFTRSMHRDKRGLLCRGLPASGAS